MKFNFSSIQGGELFERVIDEDFVLTERACACFMKQICEAMEYLHSRKVVHLDMKVKLMKFPFRLTKEIETFMYTARERLVSVKKRQPNKTNRLWLRPPLRSQQKTASKMRLSLALMFPQLAANLIRWCSAQLNFPLPKSWILTKLVSTPTCGRSAWFVMCCK